MLGEVPVGILARVEDAQRWDHGAHEARWLDLAEALRAEGWQAALTCTACPVQMEGQLPSGEAFYFRARHNDVTLSVGGDDPSDIPAWEQGEVHVDASFLPADDGEAIIRRLAANYAEGQPPQFV